MEYEIMNIQKQSVNYIKSIVPIYINIPASNADESILSQVKTQKIQAGDCGIACEMQENRRIFGVF